MNDTSILSDQSVVVASEEQVSSDLEGEAVILDMESGSYYGLNEVGARIWELIQEPTSVQEVQEALLQEYEVSPEQCNRELKSVLQDLIEQGLVQHRES